MRLPVRVLAIAILTVAVVHPAFAKSKCAIDDTDGKSLLKSAKACGFQITNQGVGKKVPAPKKVAIASFQIRFDYTSQKYGFVMHDSFTGVTTSVTEQTYLQWEKEVYQELTDKMYDMFVQTLADQGIEVVDVEAVKGSELYQGLKSKSSSKNKKKMIRATAYGLKNFKGAGGAMSSVAAANKLSGLNKELGTDAVINIYATMGLVETRKTKKSSGGTKVALGTAQGGVAGAYGGYPFTMSVLAGYKEGKGPGGGAYYFPKAKGQIFKAGEQIIDNEQVRVRDNPGFWKWKKKYSPDLEAYLRSTVTLFGWVSDIGVRSFNVTVEK
ncbi:MAG: hypothetical protein GY716_04290 [bacterium]|nr:hypothetical protein [bacterium]